MDTKNLRLRDGLYWIDYTLPGDFLVPELRGRRIRATTGTADPKQARRIRDDVLGCLMGARNAVAALTRIAAQIESLSTAARDYCRNNPALFGRRAPTEICLKAAAELHLAAATRQGALKPASIKKRRTALLAARLILGDDFQMSLSSDAVLEFAEKISQLPRGWGYGLPDPLPDLSGGRFLSDVMAWGADQPKLHQNTVRDLVLTFRTCWNDLAERGKAAAWPDVRLKTLAPPVAKTHKNVPTPEQADALCKLPRVGKLTSEYAWRLVPFMLRYTGLRIGELAQITTTSFRTDGGVLGIDVRGELKTAGSERWIPIADKLMPYIQEALKHGAEWPDGRLFRLDKILAGKAGAMQRGGEFARDWRRAAQAVGAFSCHCWRAFGNTMMLRSKISDRTRLALLGHSDGSSNASYDGREPETLLAAVNSIP